MQCIVLIKQAGIKKEIVMPIFDAAYSWHVQWIQNKISISEGSVETSYDEATITSLSTANTQTLTREASPDTMSTHTTQEAISPPTVEDDYIEQETTHQSRLDNATQTQAMQEHPLAKKAYALVQRLDEAISEGQYEIATHLFSLINQIVNKGNTGGYAFSHTPSTYAASAQYHLDNGYFSDSILNSINLILSAPTADIDKNMTLYKHTVDSCVNHLESQMKKKEASNYFFNNIYRLNEAEPGACLSAALSWKEKHKLNLKQATSHGDQSHQELHSMHIDMADNLIEMLENQSAQLPILARKIANPQERLAQCSRDIKKLDGIISTLDKPSKERNFYLKILSEIKGIQKESFHAAADFIDTQAELKQPQKNQKLWSSNNTHTTYSMKKPDKLSVAHNPRP